MSLGIALGGVVRTSDRHQQWFLLEKGGGNFVSFSDDRSSFTVGARFKAAALVRPYKNLSFGLVLTAPSIHVYGEAKESATYATTAGATSTRARGESQVGMPARIAVGFAFVKRRYTFSGDVSVNIPQTVKLAYDMTSLPDTVMHPVVQPNLNIGASVPFGTTKEVNIGFFTDLSSVSDRDIQRLGLSRVHMFGSSLTVGILGKQARAWIGVAGEIGHTTIASPGRSFTYERVVNVPPGQLPSDNEASLIRWTMTGILGSNYSFVD